MLVIVEMQILMLLSGRYLSGFIILKRCRLMRSSVIVKINKIKQIGTKSKERFHYK